MFGVQLANECRTRTREKPTAMAGNEPSANAAPPIMTLTLSIDDSNAALAPQVGVLQLQLRDAQQLLISDLLLMAVRVVSATADDSAANIFTDAITRVTRLDRIRRDDTSL